MFPFLEKGHCSGLSCFYCLVTAAAAKSLQSYPTLCNPIDSSPPGSAIPGILQARTLEWVAISFSNTWKWKVKGKSLEHLSPSCKLHSPHRRWVALYCFGMIHHAQEGAEWGLLNLAQFNLIPFSQSFTEHTQSSRCYSSFLIQIPTQQINKPGCNAYLSCNSTLENQSNE